jgi:Neuraminidase (sialidase)
MLHALAALGFGWMIYNFTTWLFRRFKPQVDKNSVYTNFGHEIIINNVKFTNNGYNGYIDQTGTYMYGKTLNNNDYYWMLPSINITQQQFFDGISNNPGGVGQNSIKVSRKRTV